MTGLAMRRTSALVAQDVRLSVVSDGWAKVEHRPFGRVVKSRFGHFADVEQERHALFAAAARSVARRPRSIR